MTGSVVFAVVYLGLGATDQGRVTAAEFLAGRQAIFGAIASISASLLGFLITAISILVTMLRSAKLSAVLVPDTLETFRKTLWHQYFGACRGLATLVVASLVMMFVSNYYLACFCAWLTTVVSLLLWDCVRVLRDLTDALSE